MEKRTIILISIPLAGAGVVASLLYLWLAPSVSSKLFVYIFCAGILLIEGCLSGVLWYFFGLRKAAPVMVSGTAFVLGIMVASSVLLLLNAPVRMALYYLFVLTILYLICVGYLSCVAAEELWERVEHTTIEMPVIRHPIRNWIRKTRAVFGRRRPGESAAERYVRINRELDEEEEPEEPEAPHAGPPPLPGQRT